MKRLSIFISSVAVLAMIGSSCGNRRACEALRKELAALECGAVFSLDTIYRKPFDSVYIHGPYSRVERPAYASERLRKRLKNTLRVNDHLSALVFVKDSRVVGHCIMKSTPVHFGHFYKDMGSSKDPLCAATGFVVTCIETGRGDYYKDIRLYREE